MDAQAMIWHVQFSDPLNWMGESIVWEILEFRAESFQRLFAPPRREESDSAIQTIFYLR